MVLLTAKFNKGEFGLASSTPMPDRYKEVTRAAVLGLGVNLLLGIAKLAGGIIGHSFALIADAVNSIGDVVTTAVVLFALRVAQRPADAEHPSGHTQAEGIAASNVALLVMISALLVGWEAIQRLTIQLSSSLDPLDRWCQCSHQRGAIPVQRASRQANGIIRHHRQRLGSPQRCFLFSCGSDGSRRHSTWRNTIHLGRRSGFPRGRRC